MTRGTFLRALETELALPINSLTETQSLSDVTGWDSMAAVQFMALAAELAGVNVSAPDIPRARTMGQLLSLLGDRLTD